MKKDTRSIPSLAEKLGSLGLNNKEAAVYSVLLGVGGGYPSKISDLAKLNRSTTYVALMGLAVKGLVTEMRRRNKIYYQIEKPVKLLRYAKERARLAEETVNKVSKFLPVIEELMSAIPTKPKLRFFEGFPEVLGIHEDHIAVDKKYEMLAWANGKVATAYLPSTLRKKYLKKKAELGITTRVIMPDTPEDRRYDKTIYRGMPSNIWPKLRFVPAKNFPFPSEITIYGTNKISILNFSKQSPVGLIIEDPIIYGMLKMIFGLSWKGVESTGQ